LSLIFSPFQGGHPDRGAFTLRVYRGGRVLSVWPGGSRGGESFSNWRIQVNV